MEHTFSDYCINGNINGIKEMSLDGCDLDEGFMWACMNGHYNIVKYLIEELHQNDKTGNSKYNKINIHYLSENNFRGLVRMDIIIS